MFNRQAINKLEIKTIFEMFKQQVYNLALQYVQNSEDAQEITQDVFLTVYQRLNNFRGESSMSTWIYRITVNKSLDFIRARKRKKRAGFLIRLFDKDSKDGFESLSDFNHPGIQLEQKESLQFVFECINELPEQQKSVLILHKIEMKTHQEISEILEVSPKAVESLVHRAKLNLLKKINLKRDE